MRMAYFRKTEPGLLGLWKAVLERAVQDLAAVDEDDIVARARAVSAAYYLSEMGGLPADIAERVQAALAIANGDMGDYLAADLWGGDAWKKDWSLDHPWAAACLRCGRSARWRPVLSPPPEHEGKAWTWRYTRPENHIPLCRKCQYHLARTSETATWIIEMAAALWGARFDALLRIHETAVGEPDWRPTWDLERFPLWPTEPGVDWAHGSGSAEDAEPRPPRGIARGARERDLARRHRVRAFRDAPLTRIAEGREPYPRRRRRKPS